MNDAHIFTLHLIPMVGNSDMGWHPGTTQYRFTQESIRVLAISVGIQNIFLGKVFSKKLV